MNRRRLEEDLGRSAPDHDDAVDCLPEGLDIGTHLFGEVALVLALFHVCAMQPLDVELVEDGGQRLDGFEVGLELLKQILVEHLGMRGALVDVVFEDVPAGEDDVVQVRQRDKFLDQRRLVIGALAEADSAHLGERTDRFGNAATDCFNAGDHRGGHGAEPDNHDSKLALGRLRFRDSGLRAALFCSAHIVSS